MPNGARISRDATAARLAEFGWLGRVPFVAPDGEVATGAATYTPDWGNLQSIETRDTITEAEAEAARQAAKDEQRKTLENAYLSLCSAAGFDTKPTTGELMGAIEAQADAAETVPELRAALKIAVKLLVYSVQLHALDLSTTTQDIPATPHE